MYTGTNPSALRSRTEIVAACLKLMEIHSIEDITVKQIMQETDISRQTFYQIFTSKDEILEFLLDSLFTDFVKGLKDHKITCLCDAAKIFFAFFDQHRSFIEKLLNDNKCFLIRQKCREYLQNEQFLFFHQDFMKSSEEKKFAVIFLIDGMVGILNQWIKEGDTAHLSSDDLARLICRITNSEELAEL